VANIYLPANANISDGTRLTIGSNITVNSLRIIANDSTVQGNVSTITPTTPVSWHYVKYNNPKTEQVYLFKLPWRTTLDTSSITHK
jgi:hypothetical protein